MTELIMTEELKRRMARIKLLAMDVDGVLTDGTIAYDSAGGEQKRFHVADGLGIVLLRLVGVETAWITGRASSIVERRASELGVTRVAQGVRDKSSALRGMCEELEARAGLSLEEVAYIGDDWNDLPAFGIAGLSIAVANAVEEVKAGADILLTKPGGQGAVREAVDMLLTARGKREACLMAYLKSLTNAGQISPLSGQ